MKQLEICIQPRVLDEATTHAAARLSFEYDRFKLDKSLRVSMITLGTIGQIIFRDYLMSQDIKFEFQLQAGQYDDFDFKEKNKIIEIKTSGYGSESKWKTLNGIYNFDQYTNALIKNFYCFVQVFISGYDIKTKILDLSKCNKAVLAGWLGISDIATFPIRKLPFGDAYLIPISSLNQMSTFKEKFKSNGS